jgi:hypothetical protein
LAFVLIDYKRQQYITKRVTRNLSGSQCNLRGKEARRIHESLKSAKADTFTTLVLRSMAHGRRAPLHDGTHVREGTVRVAVGNLQCNLRGKEARRIHESLKSAKADTFTTLVLRSMAHGPSPRRHARARGNREGRGGRSRRTCRARATSNQAFVDVIIARKRAPSHRDFVAQVFGRNVGQTPKKASLLGLLVSSQIEQLVA